jgi:hypothetical protein
VVQTTGPVNSVLNIGGRSGDLRPRLEGGDDLGHVAAADFVELHVGGVAGRTQREGHVVNDPIAGAVPADDLLHWRVAIGVCPTERCRTERPLAGVAGVCPEQRGRVGNLAHLGSGL